ncbi:MAG TPA: hypothetical protein VMS17_17825 [Gemmataceae bacterium]|nr:hypothetical protein [Gemmataceae bacterium]
MNTVPANANRVKPTRQPFRPLLAPPAVTYWNDDCGALHVILHRGRDRNGYELIPLSTDFGGVAFRWFKAGGECCDVLVSGTDSSCTCAGWTYTGGCKHLQTTAELLQMGVLNPPPGSAASDDEAA